MFLTKKDLHSAYMTDDHTFDGSYSKAPELTLIMIDSNQALMLKNKPMDCKLSARSRIIRNIHSILTKNSMLHKMPAAAVYVSNVKGISGPGDQSSSASHSHAVHLSETREEKRREEERAPTKKAEGRSLFLLLVLRNINTK